MALSINNIYVPRHKNIKSSYLKHNINLPWFIYMYVLNIIFT